MSKRLAQGLTIASPHAYYCREVHSVGMQDAINDVCATGNFDVIQLESSFLCIFRYSCDARLVIDEHNIEYELFQRMCEGERSLPRRIFNRVECARFQRFEQASWARADGAAPA